MRSSARSTDRRGRQAGFTLVEVIIASSIFVAVLIVVLQQIKESGDAARLATVQADLRRTGERAMAAIIKDIRSTQLVFATTNGNAYGLTPPTASSIQFAKVASFDATDGVPVLEGNAVGASGYVVGGTTVLYTYQQGAGSCAAIGGDKNTGYLQFQKGTFTSYQAGAPGLSTSLSQELALTNDSDWPYTATAGALPGGFQITRIGSITTLASTIIGPSNGTFSGFGVFNAQTAPVTLRIKLVLKRTSGVQSRSYAFTTVDTMVELRADQSY